MSRTGGPLNDSPLLASIVIVNYDGGEAVLDCLESVFAHLGPRQEVILVDNASVDGSPDIIKARFPEAQFIQSPSNLGFGAASNLGATRARGQYLAFLNPDT